MPLRPLSVGEILDGGVKSIRFNPQVMFGLSATIVAIAIIVSTLVGHYLAGFVGSDFSALDPLGEEFSGSGAALTLDMYATEFIAELLFVVVTPILTGLLITAVSQAVLGRKVSISQVSRSSRVWWVLGFTLLYALAVLLALAVLSVPVVLLSTHDHIEFAVLLALVELISVSVALIWLAVRTLLVPPALMLEGGGFWSTIRRAWRLTHGSFWRLLGIYLLVSLIVGTIASLISFPGSIVAGLLGAIGVGWAALLVNALNLTIIMTITTTYTAAAVALLYIDVRMRREGLDIELAQSAAGAL